MYIYMFTADRTRVIFKMNTFCHPTLPELNVLFFFFFHIKTATFCVVGWH